MADAKITQLPAATTPLAGTEKAEIVQGGVNKQVDVSEFAGNPYTSPFPQVTASGTDTYTATLSPAISAYATGQKFQILFTNANTGAATLALNGLAALAITKNGATALAAGDIPAGSIKILAYDGTRLQIIGDGGGSGGGGTVELVTGTTDRITVDNTDADNPIIDLSAVYTIDRATPSTAGGTITLDMNSQIQRMHEGSASFATPKTIAMSNTTNSLLFNFFFEVTNIAAVLTVPSDWLMADIQFDGTEWTPPETGKFELGGSFDGTNWWVKIQGPFS